MPGRCHGAGRTRPGPPGSRGARPGAAPLDRFGWTGRPPACLGAGSRVGRTSGVGVSSGWSGVTSTVGALRRGALGAAPSRWCDQLRGGLHDDQVVGVDRSWPVQLQVGHGVLAAPRHGDRVAGGRRRGAGDLVGADGFRDHLVGDPLSGRRGRPPGPPHRIWVAGPWAQARVRIADAGSGSDSGSRTETGADSWSNAGSTTAGSASSLKGSDSGSTTGSGSARSVPVRCTTRLHAALARAAPARLGSPTGSGADSWSAASGHRARLRPSLTGSGSVADRLDHGHWFRVNDEVGLWIRHRFRLNDEVGLQVRHQFRLVVQLGLRCGGHHRRGPASTIRDSDSELRLRLDDRLNHGLGFRLDDRLSQELRLWHTSWLECCLVHRPGLRCDRVDRNCSGSVRTDSGRLLFLRDGGWLEVDDLLDNRTWFRVCLRPNLSLRRCFGQDLGSQRGPGLGGIDRRRLRLSFTRRRGLGLCLVHWRRLKLRVVGVHRTRHELGLGLGLGFGLGPRRTSTGSGSAAGSGWTPNSGSRHPRRVRHELWLGQCFIHPDGLGPGFVHRLGVGLRFIDRGGLRLAFADRRRVGLGRRLGLGHQVRFGLIRVHRPRHELGSPAARRPCSPDPERTRTRVLHPPRQARARVRHLAPARHQARRQRARAPAAHQPTPQVPARAPLLPAASGGAVRAGRSTDAGRDSGSPTLADAGAAVCSGGASSISSDEG